MDESESGSPRRLGRLRPGAGSQLRGRGDQFLQICGCGFPDNGHWGRVRMWLLAVARVPWPLNLLHYFDLIDLTSRFTSRWCSLWLSMLLWRHAVRDRHDHRRRPRQRECCASAWRRALAGLSSCFLAISAYHAALKGLLAYGVSQLFSTKWLTSTGLLARGDQGLYELLARLHWRTAGPVLAATTGVVVSRCLLIFCVQGQGSPRRRASAALLACTVTPDSAGHGGLASYSTHRLRRKSRYAGDGLFRDQISPNPSSPLAFVAPPPDLGYDVD